MAGLYRVAAALLALSILGLPMGARGTTTVTTYGYSMSPCPTPVPNNTGEGFSSAGAACTAASDFAMACGHANNPGSTYWVTSTSVAPVAPAIATSCTYNWTGNTPQGVNIGPQSTTIPLSHVTTEVPDPDPTCPALAGKSAGRFEVDSGIATSGTPSMSSTQYLCEPRGTTGCVVNMQPDIAYGAPAWNSTSGVPINWWYAGPSTYSGQECALQPSGTGTSTDPKSSGPDKQGDDTPCPSGKVPGQVNGTTICVTPGTDSPVVTTKKEEKQVTNPDGSVTKTETTTTTTCTGAGSCTSTTVVNTTVVPSTGGSGSTTSTVTAGTCTTSVGCGMDAASSFGGTCNTSFTCQSEDATACAIALAVNKTQCLMSGSTDIDARAAEIAAGTWAGTYGSSVKTVGEFDQSNPFSNSCPTDQTVSVGGASFVIPLAEMCPWLTIMGNVLVVFVLFGATVFVLRGFGGA